MINQVYGVQTDARVITLLIIPRVLSISISQSIVKRRFENGLYIMGKRYGLVFGFFSQRFRFVVYFERTI